MSILQSYHFYDYLFDTQKLVSKYSVAFVVAFMSLYDLLCHKDAQATMLSNYFEYQHLHVAVNQK